MKRLPKISKADWKFMPVDPDPDFDPVRNQRIIDETIRKNDLLEIKRQKEYMEGVKEKVWVGTKYLKAIDQGGRNTDFESYFGKREAAKLRGEEIIQKLRTSMIFDSQGKVIKA